MKTKRDLSLSLGLCLIAFSTLMTEVMLIRVFEVILVPNVGYAVITCAMFAFGISGACATIWPLANDGSVRKYLAVFALLFGASVLLLRPGLNATPLLYEHLSGHKALEFLAAGTMMYLLVLIPFLLSGLLLAYLFSTYPAGIRSLYFWDLCGAALGCVAFLPFLRKIGPGGLLFCVAAITVVASALFLRNRKWSLAASLIALTLAATPFFKSDGYYDFRYHQDKRGVRTAQLGGQIEFSQWDPMAKIDVVDLNSNMKHVAYDGGSQSSHFFQFDGNLQELRQGLLAGSIPVTKHFWEPGVLISHYLKRDTSADVLIIGSAAGQETLAALLFNPRHVDGVELVRTVVRLGKTKYSDYIGGIFHDPRVNNVAGEGRSWLRRSHKKYDIIQIHSINTTSYVASGIGAAEPVYLQTVEAYEEYFEHLKPNGILHINHHFYPRMVTTAARAWANLGRSDFQSHVLIFARQESVDHLPTMLIKMSPWTEGEVAQATHLFSICASDTFHNIEVVNPLNTGKSFLSAAFFTPGLPSKLTHEMNYRVSPCTDDDPYFNNIQNGIHRVKVDPAHFMDLSMANAVNTRLNTPLGEYAIPAAVGVIGLCFGLFLVLVPLKIAHAGRLNWSGKFASLGYFSLLGSGFITIELVLIQIFIELIGAPLYTYTTVLFAMLFSAGLGSMSAKVFGIQPGQRWWIPFVGIAVAGLSLLWIHERIFEFTLAAPMITRILTAFAMIFPLAFFMGMPFPLGILWLEKLPRGAIAWAWGINGLFTVLGGMITGLLSMIMGFKITLLIGLGIYCVAFAVYAHMCRSVKCSKATMPQSSLHEHPEWSSQPHAV